MHIVVDSETKSLIKKAADFSTLNMSAFMLHHAVRAARQVLKEGEEYEKKD